MQKLLRSRLQPKVGKMQHMRLLQTNGHATRLASPLNDESERNRGREITGDKLLRQFQNFDEYEALLINFGKNAPKSKYNVLTKRHSCSWGWIVAVGQLHRFSQSAFYRTLARRKGNLICAAGKLDIPRHAKQRPGNIVIETNQLSKIKNKNHEQEDSAIRKEKQEKLVVVKVRNILVNEIS